MKKVLLTIGFTLGGILTSFGFLTSLANAQIIPMTIDPTQSSVELKIDGSLSSSQVSGNLIFDIQSSDPPSGSAQITDLNLVADDALSFRFFFGVVTASTSPGDVSVSMATPGAPGTVSGTSFNQLANLLTLDGDLDVSDPLGFAGGNQTVALSTVTLPPFDFNSVNVTQSGNVITISGSFTGTETLNLAGGVTIEIDVTYVASGVVPVPVLLGDVNLDGAVDFLDISPFISVLSTAGFQAEADCDLSGAVNFLDISPFIAILSGQ